jgi:hypothetical protein
VLNSPFSAANYPKSREISFIHQIYDEAEKRPKREKGGNQPFGQLIHKAFFLLGYECSLVSAFQPLD